jgi:hypothetical protein
LNLRTLGLASLGGFALASIARAEPSWHQVEFSYPVSAVAVQSEALVWAAGTAGSYLTGFLRWDGMAWNLADTFRSQLVYDICVTGAGAWAVGEQFNVSRMAAGVYFVRAASKAEARTTRVVVR